MKFIWLVFIALFLAVGPVSAQTEEIEGSTETAVLPSSVEGVSSSRLPDGYPALASEILGLYEKGDKKEAFKQAHDWVKEEKKNFQPWVISAALFCQEGDFKKCLKYGKKALKRGPQSPQAYYWRGRAYEGLNKPMEAANEFRAALYAQREFSSAQEGLTRVTAQLQQQPE